MSVGRIDLAVKHATMNSDCYFDCVESVCWTGHMRSGKETPLAGRRASDAITGGVTLETIAPAVAEFKKNGRLACSE